MLFGWVFQMFQNFSANSHKNVEMVGDNMIQNYKSNQN
jgi:hypothetical protein